MIFLIRWLIRRLQRGSQRPAEAPVAASGRGDLAVNPRGESLVRPARVAAPRGERDAPALSVRSLSKRFGDRVAFQDISFEIGYGEVFGFLGPNGAGKTTTVRTLGTLLTPTSGSATVAGIPLSIANGPPIRARISIM